MSDDTFLPSIIPAASGLLGVVLGGFIANGNDKRRRRLEFVDRQLKEFYGPLLALRREIDALSKVRVRVNEAAESAWQENSRDALQGGLDNMDEHERNRLPAFQRITEFDNKQFKDRTMPAYREMLAISRQHLARGAADLNLLQRIG